MEISNKYVISILFFLTLIPSLGLGPLNISLFSGVIVVILYILEGEYTKNFLVKYSLYAIIICILGLYSLFKQGFMFNNVNITNSSPEIEIVLKCIYLIFIPLIIFGFYKYSRKIDFEKVFFLFSLLSLVAYMLKVFGVSLSDTLPISSIGLREDGRFIISNIRSEFLHRNAFLCGEPSFLAGTLVVMFFLTSKRLTKLLILINLALTLSILGFIALGSCILLYPTMHVLKKGKKNLASKFFVANVFFIVFLVAVFTGNNIWEFVSSIIFNDLSTLARFNAVITSLIMIKNNIILGVGIGRYPFEYYSYEFISNLGQYKIPNPGSLYTLVFSEAGVIVGIIFVICIFKLFNKIKNIKLRIAYVAILIFWINTAHIQLIWQWSFLGLILGVQKYGNEKTKFKIARCNLKNVKSNIIYIPKEYKYRLINTSGKLSL